MVLDGPVFGFAAATAVGRVVVVDFSSDDGLVSASVFVAVTGRENCRPVMDPGLTNASDVKAKSSAWSRQRRIAAAEFFFTVTALDRIFIEVKLTEHLQLGQIGARPAARSAASVVKPVLNASARARAR